MTFSSYSVDFFEALDNYKTNKNDCQLFLYVRPLSLNLIKISEIYLHLYFRRAHRGDYKCPSEDL